MALGGSAARRYAQAMIEIAGPEVDAYRAAFEQLRGLDPGALRMLRDPGVPLERRVRAAQTATAGGPAAIRALLVLLVRKDRVALLPQVAAAYGDLMDERAGIARTRVVTAVELDAAARRRLVRRLERSTGKTIKATFYVDPDLIGGARIQMGDHLVDASLRAQLHSLQGQLAR